MSPRITTAALLAIALAGCATRPAPQAWTVGEEATIEGEILAVDTAPWAYDGNAIVRVATVQQGTVQVQLPARWNRCKAEPLGDVQSLQPHDRIHASGTVIAPDAVLVCAQPQHHLRKAD
ncbi:MAG TPA: hypothetical protein VGE88_09070 [Lysobacter sp.]